MTKILFIGPTYIGDAAIATGMVQLLLDRHRGARLTIAAGATTLPLFLGVPGLDRLLPLVKRRHSAHWLSLWRDCVGTRWDMVVDLRGSALAWFLRAGERRSYRADASKPHRSQALAAVLGLDDLPTPRLWPRAQDEAAVDALVPPGPPVIAFGPTGRHRFKTWRPEAFAELAGRLTGPAGPLAGARIAVLGAAHERSQTDPLLALLPPDRRLDLVGRTDLGTAAALMRRAALFVGIDSGLLYVATAAGIPTVGLLGPTHGLFGPPRDPYVAPWAKRVAIAHTPEPREILAARLDADHSVTPPLLDNLTVDAVTAVTLALLTRLREEEGAQPAPGRPGRATTANAAY